MAKPTVESLTAELAEARAENQRLKDRAERIGATLVNALIALLEENPDRWYAPLRAWAFRGDE